MATDMKKRFGLLLPCNSKQLTDIFFFLGGGEGEEGLAGTLGHSSDIKNKIKIPANSRGISPPMHQNSKPLLTTKTFCGSRKIRRIVAKIYA